MRLGLVGYGVGDKYFHAPFIKAAEGVELVPGSPSSTNVARSRPARSRKS